MSAFAWKVKAERAGCAAAACAVASMAWGVGQQQLIYHLLNTAFL